MHIHGARSPPLYAYFPLRASMSRTSIQKPWRPKLSDHSGPVYRAIADALEADVRRGTLSSGDPLPTQRDLADALGVNFTTVTRAYDEARRRGLITARVGRGTFVAGAEPERAAAPTNGARDLDLCVNQGPSLAWLPDVMQESLARIGGDPAAVRSFLSYDAQRGLSTVAREAGVRWLARRGVAGTPDRIGIAGGAQHALSMLLATRTQPGDVVVTEALSYPGFRSAAALARVRLVPVEMDDNGIDPDALDAVCRRHAPRLLFCVPTLQNPTTAIMPLARREALVEVARRHALGIIEDDVYGPLAVDPPPALVTLAPELVTYLGSLSKSVAPGLRTAFVLTPTAADADELAAAMRASILMLSSIPVSLAAAWIDDGTAERVLTDLRREMNARSTLARRILGAYDIAAPPGTLHAWLRLPSSWSVAAFVAQAAQRGVRIAPSDWYVTPSADEDAPAVAPQAVRLALGWEQERERVSDALSRLAAILAAPGALQPSSL